MQRGAKLREQPDIEGTNKQPSLQSEAVRGLVDVLQVARDVHDEHAPLRGARPLDVVDDEHRVLLAGGGGRVVVARGAARGEAHVPSCVRGT